MQGAASADFDVAVYGAGPAGCCCATAAAREGLRVALLEQRAAGQTGPGQVVGVEHGAFGAIGLAGPEGEELAFTFDSQRFFTPTGQVAFDLPDGEAHDVRLDRLGQRLLDLAGSSGAQVFWQRQAVAPIWEEGRCRGALVRGAGGELQELTARVTVDATGHAAALVRRLPAESGIDFTDRPGDRVLAENRLFRGTPENLLEIARRLNLLPEQMQVHVGVLGSYSTEMVLLSIRQQLLYLLVGVKAEPAVASPGERLDSWLRRVGEPLRQVGGGRGVIRIRRASLKLVSEGFAALGEAAGMVVPMHGSGVASGMLAGHALGCHLGRVLRRDRGPVGTAALWPWAARYQRRRGAVLASYDAQRRSVERLDPGTELDPLLRSRLMLPEDVSATMGCRPVRVRAATLPGRLGSSLRHPRLGLRMLALAPRVVLVRAHWQRYPQSYDEREFERWRSAAQWMLP